MLDPREILAAAFRRASSNLGQPLVKDADMREQVEYVARSSYLHLEVSNFVHQQVLESAV